MDENVYPRVAIIVPVRNEEKYIGGLIDSVAAIDYPKDRIRLIIVDGKSEDNTRSIVKEKTGQFSWIDLLDNPNQTTPFAFNIGIRHAKEADILITVGGHSRLHRDFIRETVETFSIDPQIGCVGGIMENKYEDEVSKSIGIAMSSPFGVGNAHFRTADRDGFVDTVGFPAYKREVFEKVGLFNESLTRNQDDEFNYRVIKSGYKIYLNRKIKSEYFVRGDFSKLFHQYFQYGYWKVFVNKLHSTVTSTRQLIPPLFVGFLAVGFLIFWISWFLAGMYVGIILLYLVAAMFFASKESSSAFEVFRIVYAFMILHISYGSGYLIALWQVGVVGKKPDAKVEKITR